MSKRYERLAASGATALLYAVVLTPLVTYPAAYYPSTTSRAVFFRLVVAAAGLLTALLLISRDEIGPLREDGLVWLLGGYAGIAVASALAGEASWKGMFGGIERMWGALAWVHLLVFYACVRAVFDDRRWSRFLFLSLSVSTFVVSYGFLASAGFLPDWARLWPVTGGAMGSTLGNPGFASGYLLLHVAVAALAWPHTESRLGKVAVALAGLLAVAGMVEAGSRSVTAGFALGVGLVTAVTAAAGRSRPVRVAAGSGVVLLLMLGLGVWAFRGSEVVRQIPAVSRLVSTDFGTGNLQFRLMAWEAALDGFAAHPMLGAGPENFDVVWDRFVSPASFGLDPETWRTDRTHNAFLQPLSTMGVGGALAYLGLWALVGHSLYQTWRKRVFPPVTQAVLTAVLVGYAAYQFFWFENVHTTFAFIAVVAYVRHRAGGEGGEYASPSSERSSADAHRSRPRLALAVGGLGLLLMGGSLYYHGRLLRGAHYVHEAVTSESFWDGLENGEKALSVRPPGTPKLVTRQARHLIDMRPRVRKAPQEVRAQARDSLLAAMRTTEQALAAEVEQNPGSARLRYIHSALTVSAFNLSEKRSEYEAAVRSMEAAAERAPTTTAYYRALAQLYRMAGRWNDARQVLSEALDIYPSAATRVEMARTYLEAGEPIGGVTYLTTVLRSGNRADRQLLSRYQKALKAEGAEEALQQLRRALKREGDGPS